LLEIESVANRAVDLTRQLLAFSRRQGLKPEVLDLNQVVEEMEKMLQRVIGEDIELIIDLQNRLDRIRADPGQVWQIIMNIAVNARDALPNGGKLIIETRSAILDECYARSHASVRPGPYVMLAISDNGSGMDPETRARVFEPFFTTKGQGRGVGLGLATVYSIVKQSGGSIWVYSEVGQGTTFKIYLPRVGEIPRAGIEKPARQGTLKGVETVLLVEDSHDVRELVSEILERNGYTLLAAAHGGEALEIHRRHEGSIDLVITDLVMPEMSGPELIARLAERDPRIKVLYMSGYTQDAAQHQGLPGCRAAFLEKPFSAEDMLRNMRSVLDAAEPRAARESGGE
jgi:CheY-like chemotaxis protein